MNNLTICREAAAHRGRCLEYFTIVWNSIEGLIGISAGALAGSISLVGFGIDSFIEVTSGATLLWRMSVDADIAKRERSERLSLRIVGACFLALALYVVCEAALHLARKSAPERSIPGIALAVVSLIVMPMLSRAKKERRKRAVQRFDGSGCSTDRFLRLSFGDSAGGPCAERDFGMVVGRPYRGVGDGSHHREGRLRRYQGKGLLLNPHAAAARQRSGAAAFSTHNPSHNL
jgi:hypothetical protein